MKKIILTIFITFFLYLSFSIGNNFVWNITHEDQDSLIIWKLISINQDVWQIIIKPKKYVSGKIISGKIEIVTKWIYFKKYAKKEFLWKYVLVSISQKNNKNYIKWWLYKIDYNNWIYSMSDNFGWNNNEILDHYINTWKYVLPEIKKETKVEEKIIFKEKEKTEEIDEKKSYNPKKKTILIKKANNQELEEGLEKNIEKTEKDTKETSIQVDKIKKYIINMVIYWLIIVIWIFLALIIFFAIKHKKENSEDNNTTEEQNNNTTKEQKTDKEIEDNHQEKDKINTEKDIEKIENEKKEDKNNSNSFYDEYYKIDDDDGTIEVESNKIEEDEKSIDQKLEKNPFDI